MTKETKKDARVDPDLLFLGQVLARLRERKGHTQETAAAASTPVMTSQYWGMHENGRVPGILRPAVQRKLLDAIGATPDELAAEIDAAGGRASTAPLSRLTRMARELGPSGVAEAGLDFDSQEAVFPTRDGPVVFRYPGNLTPGGFKDLEAYVAVFLASRKGD